MRVRHQIKAQPTTDGDGVQIRRIADFQATMLDPYLMIDELKSDDQSQYMGGFPAHPHRGIETFTYIRQGGFEHRDQMGNHKAIEAGDVQWMSTGRGVVHSEMPLPDADQKMHGFQIWLNMPAKEKMRPSRYQDSHATGNPELTGTHDSVLRALAGTWTLETQTATAPINELAGNGAIADLMLGSHGSVALGVLQRGFVGMYIYEGALTDPEWCAGSFLILDSNEPLKVTAGAQGAGVLLLTGDPIRESIVHWGPFVMNTREEILETIRDYQAGRFGNIS